MAETNETAGKPPIMNPDFAAVSGILGKKAIPPVCVDGCLGDVGLGFPDRSMVLWHGGGNLAGLAN